MVECLTSKPGLGLCLRGPQLMEHGHQLPLNRFRECWKPVRDHQAGDHEPDHDFLA